MLWNVVLSSLLVATASACVSSGRCKANSSIHGVFLMVDGSGTVSKTWNKIEPFVRHFKSYIDHELPIWFLQFSSPSEFCHGTTSWECRGKYDHCKSNLTEPADLKCPKTQMEKIPANWTDEQFDDATKKVYTHFQDGWTQTWHYIEMVADEWTKAKKEMGLDKDARALVVLHTDGETQDPEDKEQIATQKFKEANLKLQGVYQPTNTLFNFKIYKNLSDNPEKPDVINTPEKETELEDLVKRIVKQGCE